MIEFQMHPHEKIILTVRKHPLILVGKLVPFAILDYLPYLIPNLGEFLMQVSNSDAIAWTQIMTFENPWVAFVVGIYWLFVWMAAFGTITNHFLDQWIITNERIVDIDQKDFWSREVSTLLLTRVQDVETEVHGFFHTLFGFGTVSVETAGADQGRFRMPGLANPRYIRDLILKEAQRARKEEFPVQHV